MLLTAFSPPQAPHCSQWQEWQGWPGGGGSGIGGRDIAGVHYSTHWMYEMWQ
jgi:hypothetical protein